MNPTDDQTRARGQPNEPVMVSGTFTHTVNGVEVVSGYAYMARRATIWDAELVAWADRRDVELKRRRAR